MEEKDMVNHPPHYQSEDGLEVIEVIEAFTKDLKGIEAYDTGNVIKYICRWNKKNGLEDLEKAKWYLEDLIDAVKTKEDDTVITTIYHSGIAIHEGKLITEDIDINEKENEK